MRVVLRLVGVLWVVVLSLGICRVQLRVGVALGCPLVLVPVDT